MSYPLYYDHMMKMTKDELKAAWKSYAINFELADDVVAIQGSVYRQLIDGQHVW